ncbi:MAG: ComF family protein [Candidatus Uhrbacteria bacterium]
MIFWPSALLADILSPAICAGCGQEGSWLCGRCLGGITWDANAACIGCRRLTEMAAVCDLCRKELPIKGVMAIARYSDPIIQRIVHAVKYASAQAVADAFAVLIGAFVESSVAEIFRQRIGNNALIVPVPLHRRRAFARGFNQSELIAAALAGRGFGTMAINLLIRERSTRPQVELAHGERTKNVKDAFQCIAPDAVRGRTIVIVDDVVTTGATIGACAHALRSAGAREVWAFALARG